MQKKDLKNKYFCISAIVTALAVGFLGGWLWFENVQKNKQTSSAGVRANSPQYSFVNPLLYSDNQRDPSSAYSDLRVSVSGVVSDAKEKGLIDMASMYFRDLNSGLWTGVNEDELYSPGSMIKVVVAMATLKLAEEDPGLLSKKISYTPDSTYYKPDNDLKAGYYRVDQLIQASLVNSDNAANIALLSDPDIRQSFDETYRVFKLPLNDSTTTVDFMSAKSYSVIFRTLYNSTFFQWGLSEQLLALLSKTTFSSGLVAGVANGTPVSHKFGEFAHISSPEQVDAEREMHDCGIVYYPRSPYLICVMTKGKDFANLGKVVSDISRTVYNYVDSHHD